MRVTQQVESVAIKTGKSTSTVWRWVKHGCDLGSPASIDQFLNGSNRKRNGAPKAEPETSSHSQAESDLPPVGRRGAAAALARLEIVEERAHARLMRAIEHGSPFQIKSCQDFFLRTSETLRKLDLAVEVERRNGEEQVAKKHAEDVFLYVAEWLRIALAQFLSSESRSLMGIRDPGEFEHYAIDRFRGILCAAVKTSLKTNSPIPTWAAAKVIEAWNVY